MLEESLVPVFRVGNAADAVAWYQRLGFHLAFEHSAGPGFSRTHAVVNRGALYLILSDRVGRQHRKLSRGVEIRLRHLVVVTIPRVRVHEIRCEDLNRVTHGDTAGAGLERRILASSIAGSS